MYETNLNSNSYTNYIFLLIIQTILNISNF